MIRQLSAQPPPPPPPPPRGWWWTKELLASHSSSSPEKGSCKQAKAHRRHPLLQISGANSTVWECDSKREILRLFTSHKHVCLGRRHDIRSPHFSFPHSSNGHFTLLPSLPVLRMVRFPSFPPPPPFSPCGLPSPILMAAAV